MSRVLFASKARDTKSGWLTRTRRIRNLLKSDATGKRDVAEWRDCTVEKTVVKEKKSILCSGNGSIEKTGRNDAAGGDMNSVKNDIIVVLFHLNA